MSVVLPVKKTLLQKENITLPNLKIALVKVNLQGSALLSMSTGHGQGAAFSLVSTGLPLEGVSFHQACSPVSPDLLRDVSDFCYGVPTGC